jgi:hypothetical protein
MWTTRMQSHIFIYMKLSITDLSHTFMQRQLYLLPCLPNRLSGSQTPKTYSNQVSWWAVVTRARARLSLSTASFSRSLILLRSLSSFSAVGGWNQNAQVSKHWNYSELVLMKYLKKSAVNGGWSTNTSISQGTRLQNGGERNFFNRVRKIHISGAMIS